MTFLASIQQWIDESGSYAPLPGLADVEQLTADDPWRLCDAIANTVSQYPGVRDFDITITNRSIPFEEE